MGETATYLLPYPELDEPDDVPADVKQLAERLDILLPTFQEVVEYGQANGYTPLGPDGKVPAQYLPDVAPPQTFTVLQKSTRKDVANTTTKTDLFNGEMILPANSLTLTGRAYGVASGDFLNNTGSQRAENLSVTMGGQVWDGGTFNVASNQYRRNWRLTFEIARLNPTDTRFTGVFTMGPASLAPIGNGVIGDTSASGTASYFGPISQNVFSFDTTAPTTLAFLVGHPTASGSLSMRLDSVRIEIAS